MISMIKTIKENSQTSRTRQRRNQTLFGDALKKSFDQLAIKQALQKYDKSSLPQQLQ